MIGIFIRPRLSAKLLDPNTQLHDYYIRQNSVVIAAGTFEATGPGIADILTKVVDCIRRENGEN